MFRDQREEIEYAPDNGQTPIADGKFKQAARELECDDDKARFRERAGKPVKPKPVDKAE